MIRPMVKVATVGRWMWMFSMFVICPVLKVASVELVCPIVLCGNDMFKCVERSLYVSCLLMTDAESWLKPTYVHSLVARRIFQEEGAVGHVSLQNSVWT